MIGYTECIQYGHVNLLRIKLKKILVQTNQKQHEIKSEEKNLVMSYARPEYN